MILDKFWKSNRRLIACKGWEWNKFKPNLKLYLQIFHTLFLSTLKTLISFCVTKKQNGNGADVPYISQKLFQKAGTY